MRVIPCYMCACAHCPKVCKGPLFPKGILDHIPYMMGIYKAPQEDPKGHNPDMAAMGARPM